MKEIIILITITITSGLILQFILFRYTPLYRLNLLTKMYDNAYWVKGLPKVAIMGSSHAKRSVIPSLIVQQNPGLNEGDVVNIGNIAANPFEMWITYRKNRDKFKNVKLIYYVLNPHMLSEKYYLYNRFERIFISYKQWKYLVKNHPEYLRKEHNVRNDFFFPLRIFFNSMKEKYPYVVGENGYEGRVHKPFKPFANEKIPMYIYEPLELFPVSSFELHYLAKLKDTLEASGATFILLLVPTYTWVYGYQATCEEYDHRLVEELNKKLGPSIVLGSMYGEDYGLKYEDFADDTHLSESGAEHYTISTFEALQTHQNKPKEFLKPLYTYRLRQGA